MPDISITPAEGSAPVDSRPGWLPEKFKSPEDLATAYSELEKKLSSGQPSAKETPEAPSAPETDPIESLLSEGLRGFVETGDVPEDIITKLKEAGVSPSIAREVITSRKSEGDSYTRSLVEAVGGEESWKDIQQWASSALSEEERKAFNQAIESGDAGTAKLALYGVQAKYTQATSGPRGDLQLPSSSSSQSAKGFSAISEIVSAMQDPKYGRDEAYRKSVELRLRSTAPSILAQL